jgi:thymidylate synthase ThyX
LTSSSDQNKRKSKSAAYRDTRYTTLLEGKGSYMREFDDDNIPKDMEDLCQMLLKKEQTVSQDSLFRKDIFKKTSRKIEDRNEARVIQDIARLIVPSAETLATYGTTHLDHLIEGVNEG